MKSTGNVCPLLYCCDRTEEARRLKYWSWKQSEFDRNESAARPQSLESFQVRELQGGTEAVRGEITAAVSANASEPIINVSLGTPFFLAVWVWIECAHPAELLVNEKFPTAGTGHAGTSLQQAPREPRSTTRHLSTIHRLTQRSSNRW